MPLRPSCSSKLYLLRPCSNLDRLIGEPFCKARPNRSVRSPAPFSALECTPAIVIWKTLSVRMRLAKFAEWKASATRIEKRLVESAVAARNTQRDHRSVASGVQERSAEFRKIQGG